MNGLCSVPLRETSRRAGVEYTLKHGLGRTAHEFAVADDVFDGS